jgi:glycosyltransferase involved in cell wall biosynthesis
MTGHTRRLLAVAYHFPPIQASSGVHRLLAFTRYLRNHDWQSTVLTVHPRAYGETRDANLALIPEGTDVIRAAAWDTQRHLSIAGRYPRIMDLPDRWQSWILPAFFSGLRAIRRQRIDVLLSTFPIASAHAIGYLLHRATGLPWVADFRDPMVQDTYPADPAVRKAWGVIERAAFRHAARITVTTAGTAAWYQRRYAAAAAAKITVIPNGFDPETFPELADRAAATAPGDRVLTLLHSGLMYPRERDPLPFLRALARLVHSGDPVYANLRVVFRNSGHDQEFAPAITQLELARHVEFRPAVPYREAVAEMLEADGLLVFQAANCNSQIPAKAYEYLYAGRPIIGITDPAGDTGQLLRSMGVPGVAALEDEAAIEATLRAAIPALRAGTYRAADRAAVMGLSRESRTAELAAILNGLVAAPDDAGSPMPAARSGV